MKLLRRVAIGIVVVFLLAVAGLTIFVLTTGSAPELRPDLVTKLPEGVPPAPHGYPSEYSAALMGLIFYDLVPLESFPTPAGVKEKTDIEFGTGGGKTLLLDLYWPENMDGPRPGIVLFYGGSWLGGEKEQLKCYATYFAQHGFVAATPQYRLREEGRWPNSVQDAKCAVRWMRAHAKEYSIDPDRIGVSGNSAGAYLAMMVAYTPGVAEFEGDGGWAEFSSAAQAVVEIYGPTDFTQYIKRDHDAIVKYMNGHYLNDPARFAFASPINHIGPATPPTCLIHGTVDMLVPVEQADKLAQKLMEADVPYWYSRVNGWPHAMDAVEAVNEHTRELALKFFEKYLAQTAAAAPPAVSQPAPAADNTSALPPTPADE